MLFYMFKSTESVFGNNLTGIRFTPYNTKTFRVEIGSVKLEVHLPYSARRNADTAEQIISHPKQIEVVSRETRTLPPQLKKRTLPPTRGRWGLANRPSFL